MNIYSGSRFSTVSLPISLDVDIAKMKFSDFTAVWLMEDNNSQWAILSVHELNGKRNGSIWKWETGNISTPDNENDVVVAPETGSIVITSDITRYLLIFKVNVKVKVKVGWAMPLLADTGKPRWLLKPEVVLTSARFHRLCSMLMFSIQSTLHTDLLHMAVRRLDQHKAQ